MIIYVKNNVKENSKTRKFINSPNKFVSFVDVIMKENEHELPNNDIYDGLDYIDAHCDNLDVNVML